MKIPFLSSVLAKLPKGSAPQHDPARDWLILLAVALAFIVASIAWNGWFLIASLADESAPAAVPAESGPDTVDKAQTVYAARSALGEQYRSTFHFSDPSK